MRSSSFAAAPAMAVRKSAWSERCIKILDLAQIGTCGPQAPTIPETSDARGLFDVAAIKAAVAFGDLGMDAIY
ncbi:hypothetical protein NKI89_30175 [Mesorhizobium sp. M0309]|uniref:hypothetical protein n=1 Tax=Mesorhizobium sp. M0309 TaxID=2956933 RepID=UPI00333525FD